MEKNKKTLIWILVIIGIAILGLLIFSYPGQFFIYSLFAFSDCGNQFNNAFEEATNNNNLNFCSNYAGGIEWGKDTGYGIGCNLSETKFSIKKNNFQDTCFGAMAYSTKNIEFCKMIKGETEKGSCVLGLARDKRDISYCEVLEKTNVYYGPCVGNNNYISPEPDKNTLPAI